MNKKKIAIIGASIGQLKLCLKAKELGIETVCFAWGKGAVCKDYVDKFYPISIFEKDLIVNICREENISGVVSNASNLCAEIVAYIAERLGFLGNPYDLVLKIKNKEYMREVSQRIQGLSKIKFKSMKNFEQPPFYPCIIKPVIGEGKKGVFLVRNEQEYNTAYKIAVDNPTSKILIEEYIEGIEFSVETISFEGKHYILQITEKENSGPPNFIEISHHQPANFSNSMRNRIANVIINLLNSIGFINGAAHTECKMDASGNIYLIELNPRGAGEEISNHLVHLSTGYDYLKGIIDASVGTFIEPKIINNAYSGIYYLCGQTIDRLPFFNSSNTKDWLVEKVITENNIKIATGNHDRSAYLIYKYNRKINDTD